MRIDRPLMLTLPAQLKLQNDEVSLRIASSVISIAQYNIRLWVGLPGLGFKFFSYLDKTGFEEIFFYWIRFCFLNILYSFCRYQFSTTVVCVPKAFSHMVHNSFYLLCSRIKSIKIYCMQPFVKKTFEIYLCKFILIIINLWKKT